MSERTLVLIKPDGVARGLVGEVIGRIERKELPTAIALSRIVVSERPDQNHNPSISRLTFDGTPLPLDARLQVRPYGYGAGWKLTG